MGKNYRGLFLFEEWLEALNHLAPKTAMTIINNLYLYDLQGTIPTPLCGYAGVLQNIMLAHGRRSKQAEVYGRMGVEAKRRRAEEAISRAERETEEGIFYDEEGTEI